MPHRACVLEAGTVEVKVGFCPYPRVVVQVVAVRHHRAVAPHEVALALMLAECL